MCGTENRNQQALMYPTHCVHCISELPAEKIEGAIRFILSRPSFTPELPQLQTDMVAGEIG